MPYAGNRNRRARDANGISERAIPGLFWGRTWADARNDTGRVALVAADGDKLFRAFGSPHRLVHFMAQKTRVFETSWEAHLDTYDVGGRQVFQHIMALADPNKSQSGLIRLAERLRHPLLAQNIPGDQVGVEKEFLRVTPATVCLSAMNYAGRDLVLRLVQLAPESAEVCIDLPFVPASADLVDFRDRVLPIAVACADRSIRFSITPFQIATLRVKPS